MRRVCWSGSIGVLALALARAEVRVEGHVESANRVPLAGVRVTAQAGPDRLERITDPIGRFSFTVRPGALVLSAELDQYYPARSESIDAASDVTGIVLTLAPVREQADSVDVTAAPPALDMASTVPRRAMSSRDIINIPYPNTNDFRSALRTVPGMIRDNKGGLHLNGASEDQILFTLDGFNLNDPSTGRFDSRLSVESVESVEVSSGNLPAEYGKGSAGALAIKTHTGADKIRYSGTNFVPGFENRKGWTLTDWTPRAGISGPIRRGRTWFSNSVDIQYVKTIIRDLPDGEDRSVSTRASNLLHLQHNLTPGHILSGGFLANVWTAPRTGLSALSPRETSVDRRARQWFVHVKDQVYLSGGALVEFGYAANRTFGREIPQGQELLAITALGRRGNFYVDAERSARRDQITANGFLPPLTAAGSHQVKTGVDIDWLGYTQDVRRTGYENFSESGELVRRTVFGGPGRARRSNFETSAYAHDSWRPRPDLLVEMGVRADWDRLVGATTLVPRLGLAWSPGNSGSTKVYGGYGQVADASNLRLFARPSDQYSLTSYFLPGGGLARGPALSLFQIAPGPLQRPRYENWTLGGAHRWDSGVLVRADFLRRRGRRGFTYRSLIDDPDLPLPAWARPFGATHLDSLYDLTNARRDSFDSFSVTVRHNVARQYEWMASYTRSRALSNAVVDLSADDPITALDNSGPMPWDAPHRFVGWGYLPTPWKKWAVAFLVDTRSGFPFSTQNESGRILGKVNALRFPVYFEANLHLERRFAFRGHNWAFRFGANNLTGRINPDAVNNLVTSTQYLRFHGGNGRSTNFRIRWLGRVQ